LQVLFHIGQPKTGTSAIQGFFNYNRESLALNYGVLYPNFNDQDLAKGDNLNHFELFMDTDKDGYNDKLLNHFAYCLSYCQKNNINKIVISVEGFFWVGWPSLIKFITDSFHLDFRILCYLRRQDHYLESAWKQWGHKIVGINSIKEYSQSLDLDWYKILGNWIKNLGKDNFIIKTYEKEQIGENIIDDFLKLIDINRDERLLNPPQTYTNRNYGFNRDVIEFLRLTKELVEDEHDHSMLNYMNNILPQKYRKGKYDTYGFLSPQMRREIIAKYEPSNRKIAIEYLNRADGILFYEEPPQNDDNWEEYHGLELETALPILMQIIMKQQKMIEDLLKKY
jgi:hypothetical protein